MMHKAWSNIVIVIVIVSKNRRIWPKLGVSEL